MAPTATRRPTCGRSSRRSWAASVLLATGLLLAGCSGGADDESSAEEWAGDVCSGVGDWLAELDKARTILADPRQVSVDELSSTVKEVDAATSELVDDLQDLDAPDTDAGDEASQRLTALSDDLAEQRGIVQDAAAQPAVSLEATIAQAATIGRAVGVMITQVTDAVDDLRGLDGAEELRSAFSDAAACQELPDRV